MKAVAAVAEILKREGTTFLIGYPVNPIIEAAAQADIRTIIVRQERTGLHMADAVSRITSGQKIGVFTMQHGPGSENAFGGVAQAYGDSVPIVVLPGGYPRRITNIPPNFNSFINYRNVTKWCEQVVMGDAVPDAMRRAFTQVKNGRPRPVLVEIPVDVYQEEVPEPLKYKVTPRTRVAPDPDAVTEAARILVEAERPVIYAGQGVHYARAWQQLRELAELLEAPVTTSLEGKSAFPENHPLSLGSGGRSMPKTVHEFLKNSDVIFGIGCSFSTTNYGVTMPKGKTIVHSTIDVADLNKDIVAEHALIGEAALALPGDLGSAPHGGRGQHHHHPRRGQPPRPALALLGEHAAAHLHRLGQDHPARLRAGPGDGSQARPPGGALHQRVGRRGHRLHRHGLRNRGARAHPDPVDPAQQLLDGDRAADHEDRHREVPLHRHQRTLRGHGEGLRRLRRAHQRARRDHPRDQARHRQDPGGRPGPPRVHHRERDQLLDLQISVPLPSHPLPSGERAG